VSEPAASIEVPNPIYAIQAKGGDGAEEPLHRVEDMACYYMSAIYDSCPDGRFIFMEYSFGGWVALEMAQRLQESGEKVLLLMLLDAYAHLNFLRFPTRMTPVCASNEEAWATNAADAGSRRLGLLFAGSKPPTASRPRL